MIVRANEHEIDTGDRPVDSIEFEIVTSTDDDGIQHVQTKIVIEYAEPVGKVEGDLIVEGTVHADGFEPIAGTTARYRDGGKHYGMHGLRATAERVRLDPAIQG